MRRSFLSGSSVAAAPLTLGSPAATCLSTGPASSLAWQTMTTHQHESVPTNDGGRWHVDPASAAKLVATHPSAIAKTSNARCSDAMSRRLTSHISAPILLAHSPAPLERIEFVVMPLAEADVVHGDYVGSAATHHFHEPRPGTSVQPKALPWHPGARSDAHSIGG